MSTIRKCDGCGILSPDEDGLYIANHWTKIKSSHGIIDAGAGRVSREWHEKELCENCVEKFNQLFE